MTLYGLFTAEDIHNLSKFLFSSSTKTSGEGPLRVVSRSSSSGVQGQFDAQIPHSAPFIRTISVISSRNGRGFTTGQFRDGVCTVRRPRRHGLLKQATFKRPTPSSLFPLTYSVLCFFRNTVEVGVASRPRRQPVWIEQASRPRKCNTLIQKYSRYTHCLRRTKTYTAAKARRTMTFSTGGPPDAESRQRLPAQEEEAGLSWRETTSFGESFNGVGPGAPSNDSAPKRPPKRSLLGAFLQRHKVAFSVLVCCVVILVHGILTAINRPPPGEMRLQKTLQRTL